MLTSDVSAHPPICELPKESSLTLLPEPVDHIGFVPDEPLRVLDGDPHSFVRELYDERSGQSGLWEVTPGAFAAQNDGFAEYMDILEGRGTVLSDDGSALGLRPGVKFIARSGWRGRWVVTETIRKIYVIWTEPPSDTVSLSGESPHEEEDEEKPSRR
ncbi:MAG: cupin domain-containing protein [Marmoricola sp.]